MPVLMYLKTAKPCLLITAAAVTIKKKDPKNPRNHHLKTTL